MLLVDVNLKWPGRAEWKIRTPINSEHEARASQSVVCDPLGGHDPVSDPGLSPPTHLVAGWRPRWKLHRASAGLLKHPERQVSSKLKYEKTASRINSIIVLFWICFLVVTQNRWFDTPAYDRKKKIYRFFSPKVESVCMFPTSSVKHFVIFQQPI